MHQRSLHGSLYCFEVFSPALKDFMYMGIRQGFHGDLRRLHLGLTLGLCKFAVGLYMALGGGVSTIGLLGSLQISLRRSRAGIPRLHSYMAESQGAER